MNAQLIQDLGGRGEKLLQEHLTQGEEIRVKLKGQFGQGFVVTNKRLYIVKWGIGSGDTFGGRVNAFEFSRVTGIELKKQLLIGIVEVLTPANRDVKYGGIFHNKSLQNDNSIQIYRKDFGIFLEGIKVAREMISDPHAHHTQREDFSTQLEKLAQLKEKGLVTDEEYKAKKAKILDL